MNKLELDEVVKYYRNDFNFTVPDFDQFINLAEKWLSTVEGLFYAENLSVSDGLIRFFKFSEDKIVIIGELTGGESEVEIYYLKDVSSISFLTKVKELNIIFQNGQQITLSTENENKDSKKLLQARLEEIFNIYI